jgi:hypothetical protein
VSVTSIASLLEAPPVSSGVAPQQQRFTDPSAPTILSRLELRVVWGDLTHVAADIHIAGHYQGVLPASAENALDDSISGSYAAAGDNTASSSRGIIAEHTRRRWLVGELGEISYFPGRGDAENQHPVRRAAVAGMGRLGTFSELRASQLFASLLREVGSLSNVSVAAMNLIGTGADNLTVAQAARAMYRGFRDVLKSRRDELSLREIVIAEIDRLRAEQLASLLKDLTRESTNIMVRGGVVPGEGGLVAASSAAVFTVRAIANMLRRLNEPDDASDPKRGNAGADRSIPVDRKNAFLRELSDLLPEGLQEQVPQQLQTIADMDLRSVSVVIGQPAVGGNAVPTRISVSLDGARMRWAALTERSTIPEREVAVNPRLVAEFMRRLTAPTQGDAARLPRLLREWIIPEDFQSHIDETSPLVLEVDGASARLPWEFLTDRAYDLGERSQPLALRTPIARQLRTPYSRSVADYAESNQLRALVIADPGPPQHQLPGARAEGEALAKLLRERGVEVRLFVGPPDSEPPDGASVASELDVLTELLVGRYDIVHFAGHGTMPDAEQPGLAAGWLFANDVLTARELAQMTWAPRLVTANACWTAKDIGGADAMATRATNSVAANATELQSRLTAVLADEFLRVGVAHYIGTSWKIPDDMARRFVISFYEGILPTPGQSGTPFGEALRQSREVLFGLRGDSPDVVPPEMWSGWAAYQHYGDPTDVFDAFEQPIPPRLDTALVPPQPAQRRRASNRRKGEAKA